MFRFILIILVLNIVNFKVLASEKYCLKEATSTPVVINIFGESYQNKDDKRALLNGLNKISKSFNAGNKIRIVTHKKNNAQIQIDQCVPGCPKKGFIDKLVDTDCSDQVAKKDMVIFKNKYSRIIQSELGKGGDEYSVIEKDQKKVQLSWSFASVLTKIVILLSRLITLGFGCFYVLN